MPKNAEAYDILGINKNASKSDIESRYTILLKKHRACISEGTSDEAEQKEFEAATMAYNLLMGYVPQSEESFKPNPLMKKMGIDQKKVGNFFYYNKNYILIGIIVLLVIVFAVRGCVTAAHPDFSTAFIGQISYTAVTENLKKAIQAGVPEIKEPGFDGAYIPPDRSGEEDYAGIQRTMLIFAAGDQDMFIMDKNNFWQYAQEGAFISLDDIAGKIGADKDANKDFVLKARNDKTAHLYGIDISKSSVLKNSGVYGSEFIAAIPRLTKKQDTAVKLLKFLMK